MSIGCGALRPLRRTRFSGSRSWVPAGGSFGSVLGSDRPRSRSSALHSPGGLDFAIQSLEACGRASPFVHDPSSVHPQLRKAAPGLGYLGLQFRVGATPQLDEPGVVRGSFASLPHALQDFGSPKMERGEMDNIHERKLVVPDPCPGEGCIPSERVGITPNGPKESRAGLPLKEVDTGELRLRHARKGALLQKGERGCRLPLRCGCACLDRGAALRQVVREPGRGVTRGWSERGEGLADTRFVSQAGTVYRTTLQVRFATWREVAMLTAV